MNVRKSVKFYISSPHALILYIQIVFRENKNQDKGQKEEKMSLHIKATLESDLKFFISDGKA